MVNLGFVVDVGFSLLILKNSIGDKFLGWTRLMVNNPRITNAITQFSIKIILHNQWTTIQDFRSTSTCKL